LRTHATSTKSIPRETPNSLSFWFFRAFFRSLVLDVGGGEGEAWRLRLGGWDEEGSVLVTVSVVITGFGG
jgi:hypothetical protein